MLIVGTAVIVPRKNLVVEHHVEPAALAADIVVIVAHMNRVALPLVEVPTVGTAAIVVRRNLVVRPPDEVGVPTADSAETVARRSLVVEPLVELVHPAAEIAAMDSRCSQH